MFVSLWSASKIAQISKHNVQPIFVEPPPKKLMIASTQKVALLYTPITANLHQIRNLTTLRGTLLLELLSERLRTARGFEDIGIVA